MEVQTGENPNPNGGSNNSPIPDDESWYSDPVKVKAHVAQLRDENKNRRKSEGDLKAQVQKLQSDQAALNDRIKKVFGGGDGEDDKNLTPDQRIEKLQGTLQQKDFELEAARADIEFINFTSELGITNPEDRKYFRFLVENHMEEQDEDYEMPDEDLQAIIARVKAASTVNASKEGKGKNTTSFSSALTPSPAATGSEVTVEQFMKMGTSDKSLLYGRNPDLYNKLAEASKGRR